MAAKWLVGTNTKQSNGPAFKTKREALEYGRANIEGIFFVWKATITSWEIAHIRRLAASNSGIVSSLNTGE